MFFIYGLVASINIMTITISMMITGQQTTPDDVVEENGEQPYDKGAKSVQNLLSIEY